MRNQKELISKTNCLSQYFDKQLKKSGLFKVLSLFDNSFNLVNQDGTLLNINHQFETLSSIGCMIEKELISIIRPYIKKDMLIKLSDKQIIFYSDVLIFLNFEDKNVYKSQVESIHPTIFEDILKVEINPDPYLILHPKDKLQNLVGFGHGFTPSGDDYIWGVLMIEKLLKKEASMVDASKTTDVSKAIFKRLYKNEWSPVYIRLFEEGVGLESLLTYGHTSGQDTLYGMQEALREFGY